MVIATSRPSRGVGRGLPSSLPLLCALLAGCATSGGAKAPAAAAPPATETAPSPRPAAKKGAAPAPAAPQLSPRAQRLFDDAVAALAEQKKLKVPTDWEVLERRWRAVLEAEELPEAWFNLGVVLEHRRRPEEARAAYQRAVALRPSFREAAVNLSLLEEPADPRRAAAAYQDVLRKFPDDAIARARLAALYQASGQVDEAWRLAREALTRDPKAAGAYKVMMRVALERGNPDLAELIALRAQKLEAQDADIASFMGQVQEKREDEAAAVIQYRKALAMRPDYMPARLALLRLAVKAGNWEAVAEHARAVLQKDPANAGAHLALGIAFRHQGKADEALAEYDKAENLGGGRLPEARLARGIVLMKLKSKCDPAITELKAYIAAAGPALAGNSTVFQLQRECEQIVAANRQAEEAARQMQAEAARKAAEEAAKRPAGAPAATSAPGSAPAAPRSASGAAAAPPAAAPAAQPSPSGAAAAPRSPSGTVPPQQVPSGAAPDTRPRPEAGPGDTEEAEPKDPK